MWSSHVWFGLVLRVWGVGVGLTDGKFLVLSFCGCPALQKPQTWVLEWNMAHEGGTAVHLQYIAKLEGETRLLATQPIDHATLWQQTFWKYPNPPLPDVNLALKRQLQVFCRLFKYPDCYAQIIAPKIINQYKVVFSNCFAYFDSALQKAELGKCGAGTDPRKRWDQKHYCPSSTYHLNAPPPPPTQ